jgi:hypothetical protein
LGSWPGSVPGLPKAPRLLAIGVYRPAATLILGCVLDLFILASFSSSFKLTGFAGLIGVAATPGRDGGDIMLEGKWYWVGVLGAGDGVIALVTVPTFIEPGLGSGVLGIVPLDIST